MDFSPRRWWTGPFDVEGLAWDVVTRAVEAAAELAAVRGMGPVIDTTPDLVAASFAAHEHLRIDGRSPEGWAELSGFVEAHDGWVRLHGNYPHHAAITRAVLGIEDRTGLEREVARRDAAEVEHLLTAAGGIAVAVRSVQEWQQHPHHLATAGQTWASVTDRGSRPDLGPLAPSALRSVRVHSADGGASMPLPLEGVRVLDLTRVIAGPTATQMLACLGADVLRIDPHHRPEILAQHLSTGMGKRSALLDLRREADRLRELAAEADVILDGYRPGALAALGLGIDELEQLAPQAVIVSLSAWGESGPWGNRAGFDSIAQAATGIAARCGKDGRPGVLPVQALDHATGHRIAAHILEALARGRAVTVRANLLGAARTLLAAPPPPGGEPAPLEVPWAEVPSADGRLQAVPPPLRIDGATLELPVGGYGAAAPSWQD